MKAGLADKKGTLYTPVALGYVGLLRRQRFVISDHQQHQLAAQHFLDFPPLFLQWKQNKLFWRVQHTVLFGTITQLFVNRAAGARSCAV